MKFGERTRDCSPGQAGKEVPNLAMTVGFPELRRQCGVSHEVRWGAQGASHVVPGKSDLHARGEGERVIILQSWYRNRASRRVKKDS